MVLGTNPVAGWNPRDSRTPRTIVPPTVFANAEIVSAVLFGRSSTEALISYSATSVPAALMRWIARASSSSLVMTGMSRPPWFH